MHKTFLVLVSSVLKWGKQSIRKAKWGDCIMSCGIKEDADLWSGLSLRSHKCCWPAGTQPAQGSFMCWTLERERRAGDMLSFSNIHSPSLPSPSSFFTFVPVYFIWVMKGGYALWLQSTILHFKDSCQIKSLPKWSKFMRRFVNYS